MKPIYVFFTGYCIAECVSHLVFYFGGSLPFTSFGQEIDTTFNNYALMFYGFLALIFGTLSVRSKKI